MKKTIIFLFFILLSSLVYAEIPNVRLGDDKDFSVVTEEDTRTTYVRLIIPEEDEVPTNFSLVEVNSSDFWDDLDTPSDIPGSEFWYNQTQEIIDIDLWVNESGDTMNGTLNMSDNLITDVGQLVMSGVIISEDIIPHTTDIFSLGNSTHWFDTAHIKTIYNDNLFTKNINATEINSTDINSEMVDSDIVDVNENLTLGNHTITQEGEALIIIIN